MWFEGLNTGSQDSETVANLITLFMRYRNFATFRPSGGAGLCKESGSLYMPIEVLFVLNSNIIHRRTGIWQSISLHSDK